MEIPKLDRRSKEDLIQQVRQLAHAYLPEWQFTDRNPDMGSVAALIFVNMMQDVAERYNRTAEKNLVEFFRRLGASQLRMEPANGYVQCTVSGQPEVVPGESLPAGVRVLARQPDGGEEGESLIFTTRQPLYAVNSHLLHIFYENAEKDRIYHCYEGEAGETPEGVVLFADRGENIQSHTLSVCAGACMHLRPESTLEITFDFEDTEPEWVRRYLELFRTGSAWAEYHTQQGTSPASFLEQTGNTLVFRLSETLPEPVVLEGVEGYWVMLHFSDVEIPEKIYLKRIGISSRGNKWAPDGVFGDMGQLTAKRFQLFEQQPVPYASVYFACDCALHKPGAELKLEFYLDYLRVPIQEVEEEEIQWKHIMKKSALAKPKEYDVTVRSVVWEYYNGSGWVRLFEDDRYSDIFNGENGGGMVCLRFPCPADLQPAFLPSGLARCIRVRILRIHNYLKQYGHYIIPVISQPTFSYAYSQPPRALYLIQQNCLERRLIPCGANAESVPAAYGRANLGQSVYFCFDAPLDQPMIRLLFDVHGKEPHAAGTLVWEYATDGGFQLLACQDGTQGLSRTGLLSFQKNEGFSPVTLFARTGYWLRARVPAGRWQEPVRLDHICVNTVLAANFRTQDFEYFRVDQMEERVCRLRNPNVYQAMVYVDELSQVSQTTAEQWIAAKKAEGQWDGDGTLLHLWVLWEEVEDLEEAAEGQRCYQLDRDRSEVRFGNGLNGKLPPEGESENVRIAYLVGDGRKGNLPVGAVCVADRNLGMITRVANPLPTFGGQDRETMEQALLRSSAKLRCFGRACTAFDYEWIARMTQRNILKIKCMSCVNSRGEREPGAVTLVLLFDDMDHFSVYSERIERALRETGCCGLAPQKLALVPPVILIYDLNIRIRTADYDAVADLQTGLADLLRAYFDPMTGGNEHQGWQIGQIPTREMLAGLLDDYEPHVRMEQFAVRVSLESGEELTQARLEELEERGMCLARAGELWISARAEHTAY